MSATPVPLIGGKRSSQVTCGHDGVSTSVGHGASQDKSTSDGRPAGGSGLKFQYPGKHLDLNRLNLEDLHRFRLSLDQRLTRAYQTLQQSDLDIADALRRVMHQVSELTENTTNVVKTYRAMAQIFACDVLPQFYHTVSVGDEAAETCQMEYMHSMVNKMINDGKVVRSSYIGAMETIMYLALCTQLSLDLHETTEVDAHCSQAGLLRSALRDLRSVASTLADPADFWLAFHVTELEMSSIESAMQKLLQTECPSAYAMSRAQIYNSLSQMSMQRSPPNRSFPEWYG